MPRPTHQAISAARPALHCPYGSRGLRVILAGNPLLSTSNLNPSLSSHPIIHPMAAHKYRPVATQDPESMRSESSGAELPPQRPGKPIPPWILLGMILLLSNSLSILSGYYWASSGSSMTEQTTFPSPGTLPSPPSRAPSPRPTILGPAAQRYPLDTTTWKQFWWNTPYSVNSNRTEEDGLWEAIQPAHGFVAVDRTWAQDHDWPESMYLPSDTSKGVYLLEAYHYLHCLVSTLSFCLDGLGAHTNPVSASSVRPS